MKFLTLFAIFFVAFAIYENGATPVNNLEDIDDGVVLSRVRRFTCDVLSFEVGSVKLNHAACAAHCISLKKSGGYCNNNQVCVCR